MTAAHERIAGLLRGFVVVVAVTIHVGCRPPRDDTAASSLVTAVVAASAPAPSEAALNTQTLADRPATSLVSVYYFHRTMRCPTCLRIEELARDAVQNSFEAERASGRLSWRALDVEQPDNQHFEADFKLQGQSLIVVKSAAGRPTKWTNMTEIWDLVDDSAAFTQYVQKELRRCLDDEATTQVSGRDSTP
jgi:hypothetical protein